MKSVGRVAAIVGITLAIALFAREGFGPVLALLRVGGYGLVLAALFHVLPMIANARAWQALILSSGTGSFPFLVAATWMREAINGLLPVARVGGEVAAYRALTRRGVRSAPAAASLVVDMVLSVLSQSLFALLGVGLAIHLGLGRRYAVEIVTGFLLLFMLGLGLVLLQRSNIAGRMLEKANRTLAGRWSAMIGLSTDIDAEVRAIYTRRRRVVTCVAWQMVGWLVGAGEIWLALAFLNHRIAVEAAVLIEIFIQTVSSIAFVVPGAYGVQEGAFLLIGSALGLDGTVALAVAATRRLRDCIVFLPGLLTWPWFELWMTAAPSSLDERSTRG